MKIQRVTIKVLEESLRDKIAHHVVPINFGHKKIIIKELPLYHGNPNQTKYH